MRVLGVEIVGAIGRRPERRIWNVTGVSADSRTLLPGEMFFALRGERCDGHDYVADALGRGAAAAVVERDVAVPGKVRDCVVRVPDVLKALGDSARAFRRAWGGKIVAVTGSNGKTTTREMIHHILSQEMACKRSPKNYNTNVGLPLTLFQAEPRERVLVVEMGTNAPNEIAEMARIAEPDVGVITNIGHSHLEGLGSREGVALAKAELIEGLNPGGAAFLNADDDWFEMLSGRSNAPVISYGLGEKADLRGSAVQRRRGGLAFTAGGSARVKLSVPGRHNVHNALAAMAVARYFGVPLDVSATRLADVRLPALRYEVRRIQGVTVVSDCYNANPDSMRAALETFRGQKTEGRRIAVLGDMMELGAESERLHEVVGEAAARARLDGLWAVGDYARHVAQAAERSGLSGRTFCAPRLEDIETDLLRELQRGDALLIKGSRGARMERLVEKLEDAATLPAKA